MLVDIQNLPNTQHSLVLTARIDAQLSAVAGGQGQSMVVFDKAVVFAPGSRVSVPPTSTSSARWVVINSKFDIMHLPLMKSSPTPTYTPRPLPDDSIAFLGRWSFETAPSASSGSASPDYHSSSTVGDRAVVRVNGQYLFVSMFYVRPPLFCTFCLALRLEDCGHSSPILFRCRVHSLSTQTRIKQLLTLSFLFFSMIIHLQPSSHFWTQISTLYPTSMTNHMNSTI